MTRPVRRIGVLTAGGDCPGLNSVIRAVVKVAIHRHGLEVFGIEDGFEGLIENRMRPLSLDDASDILTLGGPILGSSNRSDPRRWLVRVDGELVSQDATARCLDHLAARGLDALVIIGGDGTMTVAAHFVRQGVVCVGVPKTIDNDLVGTDVTFGFATAATIASEAIDRIHTTAASHHRAMVIEVMGRNAGWLALHAGIASGADVILIPELPFVLERVCAAVVARAQRGKRLSIVCVGEGAKAADGEPVAARVDPTNPEPLRLGGIGNLVGAHVEAQTGIETRVTVLGHVQRGGAPVPADRLLAAGFGQAAIHVLMDGGAGRLVVMQGGAITDIDLTSVAGVQRLVPTDHPWIRAAREVGTSFGE